MSDLLHIHSFAEIADFFKQTKLRKTSIVNFIRYKYDAAAKLCTQTIGKVAYSYLFLMEHSKGNL